LLRPQHAQHVQAGMAVRRQVQQLAIQPLGLTQITAAMGANRLFEQGLQRHTLLIARGAAAR
jgi:hypothetical protein